MGLYCFHISDDYLILLCKVALDIGNYVQGKKRRWFSCRIHYDPSQTCCFVGLRPFCIFFCRNSAVRSVMKFISLFGYIQLFHKYLFSSQDCRKSFGWQGFSKKSQQSNQFSSRQTLMTFCLELAVVSCMCVLHVISS